MVCSLASYTRIGMCKSPPCPAKKKWLNIKLQLLQNMQCHVHKSVPLHMRSRSTSNAFISPGQKASCEAHSHLHDQAARY
jgi:hypothetical protein